jgi:hypothetical protein
MTSGAVHRKLTALLLPHPMGEKEAVSATGLRTTGRGKKCR